MSKKTTTLFTLMTVLVTLVCGRPPAASAGLNSSLEKFRGAEVSDLHLQRLAKYEKFIKYFTGFSYVVPNHKVSPDFLRALILAESGADHLAVSPRNALGLGQIIYSTGKQAAAELAKSSTRFRYVPHSRLKNLQKDDLFDPAVNILLTCYLIAKYNDRFNGRIDLVLTAWNAGEYTDSLTELKHAPYQETEELIGKVNAYYLYFLRRRPL